MALSLSNPYSLLRDYFTDIIERDVYSNINARSLRSLFQIAKALYESTGSELSYRNLSKVFDITVDTVKKYVEAIESSYLCLSCPFFTYSERKSVVRPRKYYPIDWAMFDSIVVKTGENRGKKLETMVFHALRKKYGQVFYWRNKREVDFVVDTDKGILPVQVSWDGNKDRHIEAIEEFKKEYPKSLPPLFIDKKNIETFI